jgi:hypothetical protein
LAPLTQIDKPQANIINKKEKEKKNWGEHNLDPEKKCKKQKSIKTNILFLEQKV